MGYTPPMSTVLALLVAALHLYFLALEMFLWEKPLGRKVFRMSAEQAAATATLAKNQGLYNGFLSAGLVWGVLAGPEMQRSVLTFFLACVVVAGAYGAATVNKRILFIQAGPAALALGALWAGY